MQYYTPQHGSFKLVTDHHPAPGCVYPRQRRWCTFCSGRDRLYGFSIAQLRTTRTTRGRHSQIVHVPIRVAGRKHGFNEAAVNTILLGRMDRAPGATGGLPAGVPYRVAACCGCLHRRVACARRSWGSPLVRRPACRRCGADSDASRCIACHRWRTAGVDSRAMASRRARVACPKRSAGMCCGHTFGALGDSGCDPKALRATRRSHGGEAILAM